MTCDTNKPQLYSYIKPLNSEIRLASKLTQLKTMYIHINFHNLAGTLFLKDASSVLFVILSVVMVTMPKEAKLQHSPRVDNG